MKHFDLGINNEGPPRLARFISDTPLGRYIEDEKLGIRHMVAPDKFVPLTDEQREAYEQGCPLGFVAMIGGAS